MANNKITENNCSILKATKPVNPFYTKTAIKKKGKKARAFPGGLSPMCWTQVSQLFRAGLPHVGDRSLRKG